MIRYFRLSLEFLRFAFSRAMEFRIDFFFRVVMDLFFYLMHILFFKIIFLKFGTVGGWAEWQVMIFMTSFLLVDALQMTFISNGLWMFPFLVNKGDLDYYLLRPISTLFFVSFKDFAANSFLNLLFALGILAWAISKSPLEYGVIDCLLYLVLMFLGMVIYYSMRLMSSLVVFWTQSGRGLEMLFWQVCRFMERPDIIYTGITRIVFVTVFPVCLVASIPARSLFGDFDYKYLALIAVVAAAQFGLTLFVWRRGLGNYSSASS